MPSSLRHLRRLPRALTLTDKAVMEAAHGRVIPADAIEMAKLAFGPELYAMVLGERWREAGLVAQILIVPNLIMALASGCDRLYFILQRQAAADQDDERRSYYRLTPAGRKVAAAEAERLQRLVNVARAHRLLSRAG